MKELGLTEHKLRFTSSVTMETTVPHHMFVERMQCELERYFILVIMERDPGENRKRWRKPASGNGVGQSLLLLQPFIQFTLLRYNY